VRAPEKLETSRLRLHRPTADDVEDIFARYASDADVTRFVAWPRHVTTVDTEFFLKFSDHEWNRSPAGPYLVRSRDDGSLLGSTGLAFEPEAVASTGYVFAKDAWGKGYATEVVNAMVELARSLSHVDHRASARVLEKARFEREGILPSHIRFPNLGTSNPCDVLSYARILN
jgi:[ribosomal protein S5]-alanine N-acetyltransferase